MNLQKKKIMLITNHDDDIYCFRKEVIESLVEYGYEVLVSCPYGDKIESVSYTHLWHQHQLIETTI